MKHILAISGSPRKSGNTEVLLNTALDKCRASGYETDTFYLSEHHIKPCIGCELCREEKRCVLSGDDMAAFIEKAALCDAILIGSPVYYRNVTAGLKALFDRTHGYDSMSLFKGKPGGAITVGRGEGGGQAKNTSCFSVSTTLQAVDLGFLFMLHRKSAVRQALESLYIVTKGT